MTNSTYSKKIYSYWARRFNCSPEEFDHPNTKIIAEAELGEKGRAHLYTIKQMAVLRAPPELAGFFEQTERFDLRTAALDVQILQRTAPERFAIEAQSRLLDHFLREESFTPRTIPDGFAVRELDGVKDDAILRAFYAQCSAEDLDEAEIYLDEPDPLIIGLFDGDVMAAYASHRYWDDLADIGVLVRADYRRRGLGKAVVSEICKWCFAHDVVPMYRVFTYNAASLRIPQALGFGDVISVDTLHVGEM